MLAIGGAGRKEERRDRQMAIESIDPCPASSLIYTSINR